MFWRSFAAAMFMLLAGEGAARAEPPLPPPRPADQAPSAPSAKPQEAPPTEAQASAAPEAETCLARLKAAGFEIVDRRPMFVLMNYPADTRSMLVKLAWTGLVGPAAVAEPLGWAIGALLYPVERALTRILRQSPSTEVMTGRRPR